MVFSLSNALLRRRLFSILWNSMVGLLKSGVLGFMVILAFAATAQQAAPSAAIAERELTGEGQETYRAIRKGGPFPFEKDGVVFGNRERLLPPQKRGFYREYTVITPGERNRGSRRIVCGGPARTPEVCYYTADHYASFRQIVP